MPDARPVSNDTAFWYMAGIVAACVADALILLAVFA